MKITKLVNLFPCPSINLAYVFGNAEFVPLFGTRSQVLTRHEKRGFFLAFRGE